MMKMCKKMMVLITVLIMLTFLTSCMTTHFTTDIGVAIGNSFTEAFNKGTISAEESIKAWPYVSGLIKGTLSKDYEFEFPSLARSIIESLDKLAAQETRTVEENGFIIGSYLRLEKMSAEYAWDKHGITIFNWFKSKLIGD